MKSRGSLPALYSMGVGLQVGCMYLDRSHDIYLQGSQYLAYPIRSSFVSKDPSRRIVVHADLCRAPRNLILWAGPPLDARPMYSPVGIGGYTPTHAWMIREESVDAGPTRFSSNVTTSRGPGPWTKAGRGAASTTPDPSRLGQTSRITIENTFCI
jgi:hypothetical protein